MKKPYRILVTSDWHCGATTGLTRMDRKYARSELVDYEDRRDELWNQFTHEIIELKRFDELWVIGDIVNGPANGNVRRDNLNNVLTQQKEMAKDIIAWMKSKVKTPWNILIVEGTEWHVGDGDIEMDIANYFGTRATKGKMITRNGVVFDVKHTTGGSNRPHLIGNSLVQEYTAAVNNHQQHGTPVPDVIIRAHRHLYHRREGVMMKNGKKTVWVAIILPALQTWGSDYAKKMSATSYPDIGFVHIDLHENGRIDIVPHFLHLKSQVPK